LASSTKQESLSGEPLTMGTGGAFAPRGGAILESGAAAKPVAPPGEAPQSAARAAMVTLKLASSDATQRFEQLLAECEIAPADVAGRKKEGDAAETGRFARDRDLLSR